MIAILCAKYQNDWVTETDVMDEVVFARFELKTSFRRISYAVLYSRPELSDSDIIFGPGIRPYHYLEQYWSAFKKRLRARK